MFIMNEGICRTEILTDAFEITIVIRNVEKNGLF